MIKSLLAFAFWAFVLDLLANLLSFLAFALSFIFLKGSAIIFFKSVWSFIFNFSKSSIFSSKDLFSTATSLSYSSWVICFSLSKISNLFNSVLWSDLTLTSKIITSWIWFLICSALPKATDTTLSLAWFTNWSPKDFIAIDWDIFLIISGEIKYDMFILLAPIL